MLLLKILSVIHPNQLVLGKKTLVNGSGNRKAQKLLQRRREAYRTPAGQTPRYQDSNFLRKTETL